MYIKSFDIDILETAYSVFGTDIDGYTCCLDNYDDTQIDLFKNMVNYIMPQEHGNHIKTKELKIKNGLTFLTDSEFEFNVSHYSIPSLMKAMH